MIVTFGCGFIIEYGMIVQYTPQNDSNITRFRFYNSPVSNPHRSIEYDGLRAICRISTTTNHPKSINKYILYLFYFCVTDTILLYNIVIPIGVERNCTIYATFYIYIYHHDAYYRNRGVLLTAAALYYKHIWYIYI